MSNLLLLIWLIESTRSFLLNGFFIFFLIIYGLFIVAMFIANKVVTHDKECNECDKNFVNDLYEYVHIKSYLFIIVFIVFMYNFIPTKTMLISYLSLNEVDKYNNKNTESTLNPENAIKMIDKTIKRVDKYFEKVSKATPEKDKEDKK